ncbi:MAG TPA: 5-oxoprolinase, partial [Gammaproteobacteria bacterium]|nr:5-oxoprolinase [Gammaproteobacteria bacterium]
GVVITTDNKVNETATAELRRQLSSSRGKIELFDFGGSVEELKAKCLSDTHLEPPTTPIFQKWMTLSANDNKS